MSEGFFSLRDQLSFSNWVNDFERGLTDLDASCFFFLQVHIHIIERLVTGLVIGSLVIRAGSHNSWNLTLIARANNIDFDQIRKTILIAINPTFHIDHLTDHIMAVKSG